MAKEDETKATPLPPPSNTLRGVAPGVAPAVRSTSFAPPTAATAPTIAKPFSPPRAAVSQTSPPLAKPGAQRFAPPMSRAEAAGVAASLIGGQGNSTAAASVVPPIRPLSSSDGRRYPEPSPSVAVAQGPARVTRSSPTAAAGIASEEKISWPDLSMYGLYLGSITLPSNERKLVLVDDTAKYMAAAQNMGFVATKYTGVYIRDTIRINIAAIKGVFPKLVVSHLTQYEIEQVIAQKWIERRKATAQAAASAQRAPVVNPAAVAREVPSAPRAAQPPQVAQTPQGTQAPRVPDAAAARAAEPTPAPAQQPNLTSRVVRPPRAPVTQTQETLSEAIAPIEVAPAVDSIARAPEVILESGAESAEATMAAPSVADQAPAEVADGVTPQDNTLLDDIPASPPTKTLDEALQTPASVVGFGNSGRGVVRPSGLPEGPRTAEDVGRLSEYRRSLSLEETLQTPKSLVGFGKTDKSEEFEGDDKGDATAEATGTIDAVQTVEPAGAVGIESAAAEPAVQPVDDIPAKQGVEALQAMVEEEMSVGAALRQATYLGINHLGQEVHEDLTGRFLRQAGSEEGERLVLSEAANVPAVYLHAPDEAQLLLCARGLVNEIEMGRILRSDDISRFLKATSGHLDAGDVALAEEHRRRANRAIDQVMLDILAAGLQNSTVAIEATPADGADVSVATATTDNDESPAAKPSAAELAASAQFAHALKLHEGQPSRLQVAGEFITPLPIGVIMQRLLALPANDETLFPIKVIESRAGEHSALIADRITAPVDRHSHVIGGFFGRPLPAPIVVDGASFSQTDQVEIAGLLAGRDVAGRGVFAMTAPAAGVVEPKVRRFLDWAFSHYNVEGLFDIDAGLVGQGSNTATRILVVGKRLTEPTIVQLPTSIPVCTSYERVWEEAEKARAAIAGEKPITLNLEQHQALANPYQAPYIPASQVSEPGMMIPRNLVSPTRIALRNLQARRKGTIDAFVCRELQWTEEELREKEYLNAEQVDAVALAIDAWKRNRAFTFGDTTGAGKGRQIAAMIRYLRLNGERPVFLTRDGDLFQDIYRDLEAIGSLDLVRRPFIVNSKEKVSSSDGTWTAKSPSAADREKIFRSGRIPRGYDLVLLTYAQINRKAWLGDLSMSKQKSDQLWSAKCANQPGVDPEKIPRHAYPDSQQLRAGWFVQACRGSFVLMDEGHEAATPGSNIGINVREALEGVDNVAYSSATFLKDVKNIGLFSRMFDPSVNHDTLVNTLRRGGEPLQEALAAGFAENGVIIRREHDLSTMRFHNLTLDKYYDRNVQAADKLSDILASLAYLSGEVEKIVSDMSDTSEREFAKLRANIRNSTVQGGKTANLSQVGYTYHHFGSRAFSIARQVFLCMKAEGVAEEAIAQLKAGRKPVITFEMTLESPLRKIIRQFVQGANVDIRSERVIDAEVEQLENEFSEAQQAAAATLLEGMDAAAIAAAEAAEAAYGTALAGPSLGLQWEVSANGDRKIVLPVHLTFRDLLRATCASIFRVNTQREVYEQVQEVMDEKGDVVDIRRVSAVQDVIDVETPELRAAYERMLSLIDELPDLQASPLDYIRDEIEKAGFAVDEISGRTTSLHTVTDAGGNKLSVIRPVRKSGKAQAIAKFNAGASDALFLSKAGSVGISLHSSPTFLDQRQRAMVVLQSLSDIAAQLQMYGRVNRLDQVVPPIAVQVSTGLPAENRQFMIQNNALRRLSANTTSNRENAALVTHMPDILNVVGNEVCYRFLENNPDIAKRLQIELRDSFAASVEDLGGSYFANQLTSRMILLHSKMQEESYQLIFNEFEATMAELDQTGTNPVRPKEFDIRAKVISSEVFREYQDDDEGSVFNKPVMLSHIEYDVRMESADSRVILADIGKAQTALIDAPFVATYRRKAKVPIGDMRAGRVVPMVAYANEVNARRRGILEASLPENIESVEAALASKTENVIKELSKRADRLVELLSAVQPGRVIAFTSAIESAEPIKGVIVDVTVPWPENAHMAGGYVLKIRVPGKLDCYYRNLGTLRDDVGCVIEPVDDLVAVKGLFDAVKTGVYSESRYVLEGNIFRAVEFANQEKVGTLAVYTDEHGVRRRGVVLPCKVTKHSLGNLPVPDAVAANNLLLSNSGIKELNSSPTGKSSDNMSIMRGEDGVLRFYYPGTHENSTLFRGPQFAAILGGHNGNRKRRWAIVERENLLPLLEWFYESRGAMLYADRDCESAVKAERHNAQMRWRDKKLARQAEKAARLRELEETQAGLFPDEGGPEPKKGEAAPTSPQSVVDTAANDEARQDADEDLVAIGVVSAPSTRARPSGRL